MISFFASLVTAIKGGVITAETEIFVTLVALCMISVFASLVTAIESGVITTEAEVFVTLVALCMISVFASLVTAIESRVITHRYGFSAYRTKLLFFAFVDRYNFRNNNVDVFVG